MADLGVAVVGAGRISAAHAPAIADTPGAVLVGVCDADPAAAARFASAHAIPHVFASWQEVLDSPDVQVVAVLLPHHLHARYTIEALREGRHVVVEKPFATSLAEADQMIEAAERNGCRVFAVQNRVYDPGIELAKELVSSGAIGDVFLAQTNGYESDGAQRAVAWLRADEQGVLLVQSIHEAYLLRWLVGDVRAVTSHYPRTSPVDMVGPHTAVVGLDFKSGAIGEMTATFAAIHGPSEHSVTLFGSGGYVQAMRRWVPGTPRPPVGRRGFAYNVTAISPARFGDSDAHSLDVPEGEAFHRMWSDFIASIATGLPPRVSAVDGRQALEVMLAAHQAAQTGGLVPLPI